MAKQTPTPESPSSTDNALTPQSLESITAQPQALEVAAPIISSEQYGTISTEAMKKGSYLTVDSRMDRSAITVMFKIEEEPEIKFEPIVDSSGVSGAREIPIPLQYLTRSMRFTLVISYEGTVGGKPAVSLGKYVTVNFYPEEHSEALASKLRHEKIVQNTVIYDMHDYVGDGKVDIPIPYLAQEGDKIYCSVITTQFNRKPASYLVVYGYALTLEDIKAGKLEFSIPRGWLARQKPIEEAITCHTGWITSGLAAEPPKDTENPDEKTFLPANALDIQYRRTAQFIGDQGLANLQPPHLRQSAFFDDQWRLNPALTKNGGDVDAPQLDTYAGDQICFSVSGPGYGSKSLGCVDIQNDGDPASIKLPRGVIAYFFNKSMTLSYTVQFPNLVDSKPQSPDRLIKVLAPQLTRPGIEQATGNTLDLNTFSDNATGVVPVWDYAQEQQCCWMWVTGTLEDGSPYRLDVLTNEPLTAQWLAGGVDTPISRTQLQKLADCSEFELHFAASFDGQCALETAIEFPVRIFSIEQEALILLPPRVCEAVDDQLTIWNGRDGVTVRVAYERIGPNQMIDLKWVRADGTSLPLEPKRGNSDPGYVDFAVPREAVIQGAGKTIPISYTVTSACKLAPSRTLALKISVPTRLPTPVVPEATPPATQGGILYLRGFTGDVHIIVEKWWFILVGQVGWLECRGTQENGSPYTIRVMRNEPITTSDMVDGLLRVIKRQELEKLRDRTALDVVFKCTAEIGDLETNAIEFPLLHLEFNKSFYDYTDFNPAGKDWNNWEKGLGATDSRDLRLKQGQVPPDFTNGYYREDWGYTDTTDPATQREKMFKKFIGLEVGKWYEFSAWVRDSYAQGNGRKPALVLVVQGVDITQVTRPGTAWQLLKGTFKASSSSLRLSLDNMEMGIGPINDYDVTGITVKAV
ncbi:hypothetical protein SAMN04490190_5819 [Pseudomonas libanensis]|uniref:hypothetical protein n=1 Tax=Pseudomonas libanensis TaxID=75588 RepID=UPI000704CA8C|nr:hypothetical protein [Pseudomonas libanensis]SDL57129.1 hypothetical protein SAMN04490190_5819 [Pseudomonas libanensis]